MKALKCLSPILLIFLSVFTFAEERTENLDHIIVVDKSLSMEDKMPFVRISHRGPLGPRN
jgi:hypothetical protein